MREIGRVICLYYVDKKIAAIYKLALLTRERMMRTSLPVTLRVWGRYALFSRPELKVDRVSYDVITPSAARAIFEAIYWKPQITWDICRIDVLKPGSMVSMTRNEVKAKASLDAIGKAMVTGGPAGVDIIEERTQRTSMILRDVDYMLHARLRLMPDTPDSAMTKHIQMFYRRAIRGQCHSQPYLGCKEFPADFRLVRPEAEKPAVPKVDKDYGVMIYDTFDRLAVPVRGEDGAVEPGEISRTYFHAVMKGGSIPVPPPNGPEVLR